MGMINDDEKSFCADLWVNLARQAYEWMFNDRRSGARKNEWMLNDDVQYVKEFVAVVSMNFARYCSKISKGFFKGILLLNYLHDWKNLFPIGKWGFFYREGAEFWYLKNKVV